ncbi:MAG TPA: FtsX-like permease family protein, partial [Vicinamibacterales bacterium]|nr:FtsX-like permease family protein [Vicinamibacterales bacterium]
NLIVGNAAPELIQVAELTTAAFATARVPPLLGRALLNSDELPGAASVVVLGYDVWQRSLGARREAVGSIVKLGNIPATVIGVMPKGFGYPINHDAWAPLPLRASYEALEGGAIAVIGRLAPGVTKQQANAEVHVLGERMAAALPATHQHLQPSVRRLGETSEFMDLSQLASRNLPVLLVLMIACLSVATLVYARTATREGEIAVRTALGAGRARIMGQLFVEALVLASVAAAAGLVAADRALTWGIESVNRASGGAPFWMTPGLQLSTVLYASGLAVVSAAMLSFLPALKVTRARVQTHLANRGHGGATLRFGRVWTGAMITQVALTAIGIPTAMETANEAMLKLNIRAAFPSREYVAARIELDRPFEEATPAFEQRRAQTFAALERAVAQEPGVIAVTFAGWAPGSLARERFGEVEPSPGVDPIYKGGFRTSVVGPGFFDAFDRPIVAGRAFHGGDGSSGARTVIVNEAFARGFSREAGIGSPLGARLRYPASSEQGDASDGNADGWFEIVGVVRDLGLDPDDSGDELPYVFHAAAVETMSPFVMSARTRGNPAPLAARLPIIAADVDARLVVHDALPLDEWVRRRDDGLTMQAIALAGVTVLVLSLSALGIFSLVSVSVSRRTREIGLRTALGASPRDVLAGILSHALVLMGTGIVAGGALLLWATALGMGPSGRPAEDVALFAGYLGVTSAVMLAACLLACIGPASRALRINPTEALREA